MADTLIVDLDGTLIDSNYQHAVAWFRAFRAHGLTPPLWRIHRAIGMGGVQLVSQVAGPEVEASAGDSIRTRWRKEYERLLPEVRPFEGAAPMLAAVRDHGLRIVLASSSPTDLVEWYLSLLGVRPVADAWTSGDDTDLTKPAPTCCCSHWLGCRDGPVSLSATRCGTCRPHSARRCRGSRCARVVSVLMS